jgi:hypothetical protein
MLLRLIADELARGAGVDSKASGAELGLMTPQLSSEDSTAVDALQGGLIDTASGA